MTGGCDNGVIECAEKAKAIARTYSQISLREEGSRAWGRLVIETGRPDDAVVTTGLSERLLTCSKRSRLVSRVNTGG